MIIERRIYDLNQATSTLGSIESEQLPPPLTEDNAHHILMLENNELRRLMRKLNISLSYLIEKHLYTHRKRQ